MKADTEHQRLHGAVLAQLHCWFQGVYEQIVRALAEHCNCPNDTVTRLLSGVTCRLESGGIVSMSMPNNLASFQFAAFLDLAPEMAPGEEPGEVYTGPRVIWELCVPLMSGEAAPRLACSLYQELPHSNPQVWDTVSHDPGSHSIHTQVDEQCRRLVIYHRPELCDQHREGLVQSWRWALNSMHTNRFMRKPIARWFTQALAGEWDRT